MYDHIITRITQYGLANFPEYSKDEHYNRVAEYMRDRYGENGYIKLWLNSRRNIDGIRKIREKLQNPQELHGDFDKIYDRMCSK